jgi:hypothetical protein
MRLGIIACTALKPELDHLLESIPEAAEALAFCKDFGLTLECTTADNTLLAAWLRKARSATELGGKRRQVKAVTGETRA